MASTYTTLLQLTLPTTGELDGTWGTTVNTGITQLTEDAIAGVVTLTTDADTTLTTANGSTDQARMAIINNTGARSTTRNITAPATSKVYHVLNATTGGFSVVIRGAGPTTGITVLNGQKVTVAWNGSDFVKVAGSTVAMASEVTGTLPVANGGTGAATLTANYALLGNGTSALQMIAPGTSGNLLTSNGTTWASTAPATSGTVTSVAASVPSIFSISGSPITTSGTLAMTYSGTALPVANGGTGATTLTANNVILGNGSSAVAFVAPSTSGNVLTSNGTTWASTAPASTGLTGFRRRNINGAVTVDQRNKGVAVTVNSTSTFRGPDMWSGIGQAADGVFTMQQVADGPTGFVNSLKVTVSTSDASIGSGQSYVVRTKIEGQDIADFAYGTASAVATALSFWVKSSVTGAFSGSLQNSAANRSYPFSYTINSANTWELKSVLLTGDTTGTWLTDTGIGLIANFSIGVGTTGSGTAATWAGSTYYAVTSGVNLISTNAATWNITAVQVETAAAATTFEQRPINYELEACQRYLPVTIGYACGFAYGVGASNTALITAEFAGSARIAPTGVTSSTAASNFNVLGTTAATTALTSMSFSAASLTSGQVAVVASASSLVAGNATVMDGNATNYLIWTGAEL